MSVLTCLNDGCLLLDCPGCGFMHEVYIDASRSPCWTWNGDMERPTFHPSIRVQWRWGTLREPKCCHFFVRDGHIEFCADSAHDMAGLIVPMKVMKA